MKRITICLLLAALILCLPLAVGAEGPDRIVDNADLLTSAEEAALWELASAVVDQYVIDVVIVTTNTLDGKTAESYADDFFDDHGYGAGDDFSGVLLLVSMEDRDWAISTSGEAIYALTDYGIGLIADQIVPYLSEGEYYAAFEMFLAELDVYFNVYRNGDPIDGGFYEGSASYQPGTREDVVYYGDSSLDGGAILERLVIALLLGAAAGGVSLWFLRGQMKTARPQSGAKSYMVGGSYNLYRCQDFFLYSRTTRIAKPEPSSNHSSHGGGGGGGSSVHHSSSGHSHGGGHGKF